jgi:hypothetical protein
LVQFKGRVEPGRAPAGEGRKPVGCVELAMTHRFSVSRSSRPTEEMRMYPRTGFSSKPAIFIWAFAQATRL